MGNIVIKAYTCFQGICKIFNQSVGTEELESARIPYSKINIHSFCAWKPQNTDTDICFHKFSDCGYLINRTPSVEHDL